MEINALTGVNTDIGKRKLIDAIISLMPTEDSYTLAKNHDVTMDAVVEELRRCMLASSKRDKTTRRYNDQREIRLSSKTTSTSAAKV